MQVSVADEKPLEPAELSGATRGTRTARITRAPPPQHEQPSGRIPAQRRHGDAVLYQLEAGAAAVENDCDVGLARRGERQAHRVETPGLGAASPGEEGAGEHGCGMRGELGRASTGHSSTDSERRTSS